uniref:Uncharacterized protein n=1 Tax=Neobodo designis TaxID=312471 RepID=A0A7S1MJI9_NEODS|mmetsp:Transcript_4174/g.13283  ORF Transcript_4174/g.13283 Transcript_4174/m.13283 type:complete len:379 (+) Transcript_4174:175-1311(+)|eukprot:CAMPEP_0174851162 /NCGR_PEP_ID=MMETSP1114-20130205/22011_1 /TAXON_ID=312471 /ORGANISM="Neobodo designis, Strain CCAP 1951/1" /LENGTH=378 /DNA_ID=CAMNT_0016085679 /DNA_START=174 /DNA_END=1310 /DNA_ORIENTATION=+
MSVLPRDEYQPRRGVAMKIVEPNPNLRTGVMRDAIVEAEAKKFEAQEFILSKAMTDKAPKPTKVKTFRSADIPWATGNGNVIAPPKPEPRQYRRIIGHRVPEDKMERYYHGDALERCRQAEQMRMEHARNFSDNFSPQPAERMHKIVPHTIKKAEGLAPINGFPGLGSVVRERPTGKAPVAESTFDPLGMRSWAPRVTGLKRLPTSDQVCLAETALQHDDGIPFESTQKKKYRTPHRHEFQPTHGPEDDLGGFRGLGSVDKAPPPRGRRHSPRAFADHHSVPATGVAPEPHQQRVDHPPPQRRQSDHHSLPDFGSPHHHQRSSGGYQQPQPQQSQQYRSASSLGIASPNRHGAMPPPGGRVSAPPGLGTSVRFHAQGN